MASVQKRGEGRYLARVVLPGGREVTKTWARKVDAERWAREEQAKVDRGAWVDPNAGRETVKAYAERWRLAQPHRPSTVRLYERTLRLHVYPKVGDRPLATVRRSDVQALITGMSARLGPVATDNAYKLVRAIFRSAVEDQLITVSPCRRIARSTTTARAVVPVPLAKVAALAEAIPARFRALVLLAAGSGLRQGEVLGLTIDRVDFLRREIRVDAQLVQVPGTRVHLGPPKTPQSVRTVPVPALVTDAIAAHLLEHPTIAVPVGLDVGAPTRSVMFANSDGGVLSRSSFHRTWVLALAEVGLPEGTHFHDLRHTYASVLIEGGESVTVVAARLGHANATETLRTYSHLWPDNDDRTRSVVERAFAVAVGEASDGLAADSSAGTAS